MRRLVLLAFALAALAGAQQKKIVVLGMSAEQVAEMRTVTGKVRIVQVTEPATDVDVVAVVADTPAAAAHKQKLLREVAGADAIIGGPSEELVKAAPKLKWVQLLSAGVEPYMFPAMVESDIVLCNAKVLSSPGIAGHGFAMLLALTRMQTHFIAIRPDEIWDRKNYDLLERQGATALVIGTGGIGSGGRGAGKGLWDARDRHRRAGVPAASRLRRDVFPRPA